MSLRNTTGTFSFGASHQPLRCSDHLFTPHPELQGNRGGGQHSARVVCMVCESGEGGGGGRGLLAESTMKRITVGPSADPSD